MCREQVTAESMMLGNILQAVSHAVLRKVGEYSARRK